MSNRQIVGVAAVACAVCCIGPILGILSAIAALDILSTAFIGLVGLAVTIAALTGIVILRKRRRSCPASDGDARVPITPRR